MTINTTGSAGSIFAQVALLFTDDVYKAINPVIASTLADIEANPGLWTNPLTAPIKGAAAVAALLGVVPNIEMSAVHDAAALVAAMWTHVGADLANVTPSLPTVAAEVAATTTTVVSDPVASGV
jgi:hypothetical protein